MSDVLIIRKGKEKILEMYGSHPLREVLGYGANYDEQVIDPKKEFSYGIEVLRDKIRTREKNLRLYEKILEVSSLPAEEVYGAADEFCSIEEEIKALKKSIIKLQFLIEIAECDNWEEDKPAWTKRLE